VYPLFEWLYETLADDKAPLAPGRLAHLIRADNFYLMADPIWREIYSAAVSTGFNPLFNHLFTVYFEFDFVVGRIGSDVFYIRGNLIAVLVFIFWHLDLPLSDNKMDAAGIPL
jgi:hypothetical protein